MSHFSWLDYTIFGVYLTASVAVGLLSARGQKSLGDYFLAGRGMGSILVGLSILAALFSGISYLAAPAEVYKNGFAFAYAVLAFFIATPFTALWMMPKFYQSRYFTAYQFLEERFSLPVRLMASGLFIFRVSLWLAAATFAPALALEKVTGIPLWITILATGVLTTLYTALRRDERGHLDGRDAVDRPLRRSVRDHHGRHRARSPAASPESGTRWSPTGAWTSAFPSASRSASTSGSVLFAAGFMHLVQMATDQVSVQRYLSAGSLREARRSLWIKLWFVLPVLVLFYGTGLVLYAFYKVHGDPLAAGLDRQGGPDSPLLRRHPAPAGPAGTAHRRDLRREHVHHLRRPQFTRLRHRDGLPAAALQGPGPAPSANSSRMPVWSR